MTLRREIEGLLQERRGWTDTYADRPEDSLMYRDRAGSIFSELSQGSGSELSGNKPKFQSVASSSALAVNSFLFWRGQLPELSFAGETGFSEMCFEKKLPSGLHGTPPNLDVYLRREVSPICVESKFLEPISDTKKAKFSESYESIRDIRTSSRWYEVYRKLIAEPSAFIHVDAAQLVKHFFGICNPVHGHKSSVLVYLYWEPTNGDRITAFAKHAEEVQRMSSLVKGDDLLVFKPLTYRELWDEWSDLGGSGSEHAEQLRKWYEIEA